MFGQYFGRYYFGDAWFGPLDGSAPPAAEKPVDGSGLIITRRRRKAQPVRPIDTYRTPQDIRREQLETERYLASLEQNAPLVDPAEGEVPQANAEPEVFARPVAHPILADVAARAASAVQEKLEEADSAAALVLLAEQQQRRRLVLLLALD